MVTSDQIRCLIHIVRGDEALLSITDYPVGSPWVSGIDSRKKSILN